MSPTWLLDSSVVIALTVAEHEHHQRALRWASTAESWAMCPIVEGALARFLIRIGESAGAAQTVLHRLRNVAGREFWPDSLSYIDTDLRHVRGHRQVTDAYLVSLALAHGARLATLDQGLAAEKPDAVTLIPAA